MVAVAQLVESRIVIPVVVGSSPIGHPKKFWSPLSAAGFLLFGVQNLRKFSLCASSRIVPCTRNGFSFVCVEQIALIAHRVRRCALFRKAARKTNAGPPRTIFSLNTVVGLIAFSHAKQCLSGIATALPQAYGEHSVAGSKRIAIAHWQAHQVGCRIRPR